MKPVNDITDTTPPPAAENLTRLARAIRRTGQDFALFFAECNLPKLRRQLADDLNERLETAAAFVDIGLLPELTEHTPLDKVIALQLANEPDAAPVFLFGLEHMLPTLSKEKIRSTVQQLNWRRGAFGRLQRPLVIWLPSYAMEILAEHTPDFYDWYSGTFNFPADANSFQLAETNTFQQLNQNPAVDAADHMTAKEKKRWLTTLKSLITSHTNDDKSKVDLLTQAAKLSGSLGDRKTTLKYYEKALDIQRKMEDKKSEAVILNNIASIAYSQGNYDDSLKKYRQSLDILKTINEEKEKGTTLNNISLIYSSQGKYKTALKYLEQALKIAKKVKDKNGEGAALNNISLIHDSQGEHTKALYFLLQSLALRKKIGDKHGEAKALNNIASIYKTLGDNKNAFKHLQKALTIQKEIGDIGGQSSTLNNLSAVAYSEGNIARALDLSKQDLRICQETNDQPGMSLTMINIGYIYWQNKEQNRAVKNWAKSYRIAKKIGLSQALQTLSTLAKQLKLPNGINDWEALANYMEENPNGDLESFLKQA